MAGIIGAGVSLRGIIPQAFAWTWNVTGTVAQSNVGELVQQDIAADNAVKLLVDDGAPIGSLASYENRVQEGIKVGTVNHKGGFTVGYTGAAPTKGNSVLGSATPGKVKLAAAGASRALVVAVDTTAVTVTVVFI